MTRLIPVCVCVIVATESAAAQVGQPLTKAMAVERLKTDFPGVQVLDDEGGHMRCAFGVKMNAGESAEDAALAWVEAYGEALCGQALDVEVHQTLPVGKGKRVVRLRQFIDGTPVEEPGLRVLAYENDNRVAFVGGRVLEEPVGGLAPAKLSAAEALAIAKGQPKGKSLDTWLEPRLVVTRESEGSRVAVRAWKAAGWSSKGLLDSWSFYVDAATGEVVRVSSNVLHFAPDITGTVTGYATPGVRPDMRCPQYCDTSDPPVCGEPNPPVSAAIDKVLVEARDPSTNELLASTHTDGNGDYTLQISSPATVNVVATLGSEYWNIYDYVTSSLFTLASTSVSTSGGQADFIFSGNPHPEHDTAGVNAHVHIDRAREFFKLRLPPGTYPGIDDYVPVIVNYVFPCNAYYVIAQNHLLFSDKEGTSLNDCPNTAAPMTIAHEYGHYIQQLFYEIDGATYPGFHEGFSDSFSMVHHDFEPYAPDGFGCGTHVRDPLGSNHQYPVCHQTQHTRGELLGAIWIRIGAGIGASPGDAADLFFDWAALAVPPGGTTLCTNSAWDQSADEGTFIEVLTADDDDGNIGNGTPNGAAICAAFDAHGITIDESFCEESAGLCYADFDGSGHLDVHDFLRFALAFEARERAADCDGYGSLDAFDWLCFTSAFAAGCDR